jgi:hypothetical protein
VVYVFCDVALDGGISWRVGLGDLCLLTLTVGFVFFSRRLRNLLTPVLVIVQLIVRDDYTMADEGII